MALARLSLARLPGAQFWKLCGSGTGEGFTPIPNTQVWAILTVWEDEASARAGVESASVYRRWRRHAAEEWTVYLSATSARGAWSGSAPFVAADAPATGPIAVLTRATLKARALPRFWGRVPGIEAVIGGDPNVMFKIGIGEVPWLHQVTFSIWPDVASMAEFARRDGPHAHAIRAVREGNWFKEELYARFRVLGDEGAWGGSSPLAPDERKAA